jgi:hypothetical protein
VTGRAVPFGRHRGARADLARPRAMTTTTNGVPRCAAL